MIGAGTLGLAARRRAGPVVAARRALVVAAKHPHQRDLAAELAGVGADRRCVAIPDELRAVPHGGPPARC